MCPKFSSMTTTPNIQSESKCYLKQQEQGVHVQPCTEKQDNVSYKEKENACI